MQRGNIMPRGPNSVWRPADPNACAVHVGRILTGEISASAKRASAARWGAAVLAAVLLAPSAAAQDAAETFAVQTKLARVDAFNREPQVRNLIPPGQSTSTRTYLRVELHQGGLYEPSLYPTETWLQIACIHDDLQVEYNLTTHGSSLFKVHALVYDEDFEEIHNTIDTTTSDEAICSVSFTADTSFIELSRSVGRRAAAVALLGVSSSGQYVEASKVIYRILPD